MDEIFSLFPPRSACLCVFPLKILAGMKTGSDCRKKTERARAHDGQIKACLCLREKRSRRMRGGGGGGRRDEGASLLKEVAAAL